MNNDEHEMSIIDLTADTDDERLDKHITHTLDSLSRNEVQALIKAGQVTVNGRVEKASFRLSSGDSIRVELASNEDVPIEPEQIDLDILYEDDDLVAIHKPAGMVVHPAFGHRQGTLVNAALWHWPQIREVGGAERAGVVHRLDKDTSGVIVMAKTNEALTHLQSQFKARTTYKRYLTLVEGIPPSSSGVIDAPIGRDPKQRKRMAVVPGGRESITRYDLVEDLITHALLGIEMHTGRTHQIRVHCAWLGHPVVGDPVYGYRKQRIKIKRLFLHAAELQLDSPSDGDRLTFTAPLPSSLEHVLVNLRKAIK